MRKRVIVVICVAALLLLRGKADFFVRLILRFLRSRASGLQRYLGSFWPPSTTAILQYGRSWLTCLFALVVAVYLRAWSTKSSGIGVNVKSFLLNEQNERRKSCLAVVRLCLCKFRLLEWSYLRTANPALRYSRPKSSVLSPTENIGSPARSVDSQAPSSLTGLFFGKEPDPEAFCRYQRLLSRCLDELFSDVDPNVAEISEVRRELQRNEKSFVALFPAYNVDHDVTKDEVVQLRELSSGTASSTAQDKEDESDEELSLHVDNLPTTADEALKCVTLLAKCNPADKTVRCGAMVVAVLLKLELRRLVNLLEIERRNQKESESALAGSKNDDDKNGDMSAAGAYERFSASYSELKQKIEECDEVVESLFDNPRYYRFHRAVFTKLKKIFEDDVYEARKVVRKAYGDRMRNVYDLLFVIFAAQGSSGGVRSLSSQIYHLNGNILVVY